MAAGDRGSEALVILFPGKKLSSDQSSNLSVYHNRTVGIIFIKSLMGKSIEIQLTK